jgi:hypothetical protein
MKKILIKSLFILLIFVLLFGINSKVYASDIISKGKDFIGQANADEANISITGENLSNLSDTLSTILLSAGIVIAVIVATILGIQFMMGGAEGQAKVKEMLVPFVVGCIVVFGAFGIWKIALSIGKRLDNAGGGSTSTVQQSQGTAQSQSSPKTDQAEQTQKSVQQQLAEEVVEEAVKKEPTSPYSDKYKKQQEIQNKIDLLENGLKQIPESKKDSKEYKDVQEAIEELKKQLRQL